MQVLTRSSALNTKESPTYFAFFQWAEARRFELNFPTLSNLWWFKSGRLHLIFTGPETQIKYFVKSGLQFYFHSYHKTFYILRSLKYRKSIWPLSCSAECIFFFLIAMFIFLTFLTGTNQETQGRRWPSCRWVWSSYRTVGRLVWVAPWYEVYGKIGFPDAKIYLCWDALGCCSPTYRYCCEKTKNMYIKYMTIS